MVRPVQENIDSKDQLDASDLYCIADHLCHYKLKFVIASFDGHATMSVDCGPCEL